MTRRYNKAVPGVFERRAPSPSNRLRVVVVAVVLIGGTLILPASTSRAHGPLTDPVQVSGPDPLPNFNSTSPPPCGSAAGTPDDSVNGRQDFHGWESEATIAVNPTDPTNLVAAWAQANKDAIVVGYSTDGGKSWTHKDAQGNTVPNVAVPPTTKCTEGGEPYGSAHYPWIAFGPADPEAPDGRLYLSSLIEGADPPRATALMVSTSVDGGRTWSKKIVHETATIGSNTHVIADPNHPETAYVWWKELVPGAAEGVQYVARTTNGGDDWVVLPPVPPDLNPCTDAAGSPEVCVPVAGRLLLLGDGTLVDVFTEIPSPGPCTGGPPVPCNEVGPTTVAASRLENPTTPGSTWSVPVEIEVDPLADATVFASVALAPKPGQPEAPGTIHVSWQEIKRAGTNCQPGDVPPPCITLTDYRSTNGGLDWMRGTVGDAVATQSEQEGGGAAVRQIQSAPSLAVASDGTIGLAFYDHRFHPGLASRMVTDLWFRHSHDGGQTWEDEVHLAGPFDHSAASTFFGQIGRYQGIAAIPGGGFATAYTLGAPLHGVIDPNTGTELVPNFTLGGCAADDPWPSTCVRTDIFSTIIDLAADLSITKTGPPGRVPTGRNMTYTLSVTNNGPDGASDVVVTDTLPPSVTVVNAAIDLPVGHCDPPSEGILTCQLGPIGTGVERRVYITVTPTQAGMITNSASVASPTPDPNQANNTDSEDTAICRITSRRSSIPCG